MILTRTKAIYEVFVRLNISVWTARSRTTDFGKFWQIASALAVRESITVWEQWVVVRLTYVERRLAG